MKAILLGGRQSSQIVDIPNNLKIGQCWRVATLIDWSLFDWSEFSKLKPGDINHHIVIDYYEYKNFHIIDGSKRLIFRILVADNAPHPYEVLGQPNEDGFNYPLKYINCMYEDFR